MHRTSLCGHRLLNFFHRLSKGEDTFRFLLKLWVIVGCLYAGVGHSQNCSQNNDALDLKTNLYELYRDNEDCGYAFFANIKTQNIKNTSKWHILGYPLSQEFRAAIFLAMDPHRDIGTIQLIDYESNMDRVFLLDGSIVVQANSSNHTYERFNCFDETRSGSNRGRCEQIIKDITMKINELEKQNQHYDPFLINTLSCSKKLLKCASYLFSNPCADVC